MGLDMYLNRRVWVWPGVKVTAVEFTEDENLPVEGRKPPVVHPNKVQTIVEEVIYWRKANAIHCWFVENVQGGVDDCEEYQVTREQLQALLEVVTNVAKDHSLASELLPTQEGFFFGTTEYDEYYFDDVATTIERLTTVLNDPSYDDSLYYYQSSW